MDIIEEIKSRISIEQLVAQYVQLKPAGKSFKGLCPFHSEKTPSFVVSPEKQIAWCFGCQKGGDIFGFTQAMENCDFKESVNILAEKASIDIKSDKYKKSLSQSAAVKEKNDILFEIMETVVEFYRDKLWNTKDGEKVIEYLKNRGISDEMIKEFSLGLSPDSFEETYKFLINKGFQKRDILDCGLLSTKDTYSDEVYDKFRLRLMFPIFDNKDQIVGFGARALKKDDEPKYLNSPETQIYNKSKVLYNFDKAKLEIKKKDEVIFVEGYMDTISTHQASIKNVVATCGTALTKEQLKLIKRFTKNISLLFDNDKAGFDATMRAIFLAQEEGFNIYIIHLSKAKDASEFALKYSSEFVNEISNKIFYLDFLIQKINENYDLNNINEAKKAQDFIIPIISGVKDDWERDAVIQKYALFMKMQKSFLTEKVNLFILSKIKFAHQSKIKPNSDLSLAMRANQNALEYIIGLEKLFEKNIQTFMDIIKDIPDLQLPEPLKNIYNKLIAYYTHATSVYDIPKFSFLDRGEQEYIKILQLKSAENMLSEDKCELIFEKALLKLKQRVKLKRRLNFKSSADFSSDDVLDTYNKQFIL